MNSQINMLGTGSAFPQSCYNTCFIISLPGFNWMVDTGGGNEIIKRIKQAGFTIPELRHLFITHSHTDHILGAVWIIRSVINLASDGNYEGKMHIYGNTDVINTVMTICKLTLLEAHYAKLQSLFEFHNTDTETEININDTSFNFFDCGSENVRQTGFRMTTPDGIKLVCLGDEALNKANSINASDCDWLMCGAFCRDADKDIFKPYEKHHLTVKDVAITAAKCNLKNLVLYHCEDRNLAQRERLYKEEAEKYFRGNIFIPGDGDKISLNENKP